MSKNPLASVVEAQEKEIAYLRSQVQQERDRYSALVAATFVRSAVSSHTTGQSVPLIVPSLQPPGRTAAGAILTPEPTPQGAVDMAIDAIADGAPNPAAVRKSLALHAARLGAQGKTETEIIADIELGGERSTDDED